MIFDDEPDTVVDTVPNEFDDVPTVQLPRKTMVFGSRARVVLVRSPVRITLPVRQ